MTAIDITTLEASIEALIQQQVAAYEARLREALGRRLAPRRAASQRQKTGLSTASSRRQAAAPRRSAEELRALGDAFFSAVAASPGETMTTLAAGLGLRTKDLERPVLRLKREERVKTVGERNHTRYYPMTARSA